MNFGKTILDLRRAKNVTQEELAAELGVTAAAVSKWENNYTLPDIMMLCAIADYFDVTTDELLGRTKPQNFIVIAAKNMELGQRITDLAFQYGFVAHGIYSDLEEAVNAAAAHPEVKHIVTSLGRVMTQEEEEEIDKVLNGVTHVNSEHETEEGVLNGLEIYFRNLDVFQTLSERKISTVKKEK